QQWHKHECTFQLVYVLNGWATFGYEGQGQRTIRKGDCILQTPGIRHREIACSDDFGGLGIVSPAGFPPPIAGAPQGMWGRGPRARCDRKYDGGSIGSSGKEEPASFLPSYWSSRSSAGSPSISLGLTLLSSHGSFQAW